MVGVYKYASEEYLKGLEKYLFKAEIKYVAENGGNFIECLRFDFLGDGEIERVKKELHEIGLVIESEWQTDDIWWLKSNEGISISSEGFVVKLK